MGGPATLFLHYLEDRISLADLLADLYPDVLSDRHRFNRLVLHLHRLDLLFEIGGVALEFDSVADG